MGTMLKSGMAFTVVFAWQIARGVFTSVPDLRRKLMRYIRQYNKAPKTVKRRYSNIEPRITPDSGVTVH